MATVQINEDLSKTLEKYGVPKTLEALKGTVVEAEVFREVVVIKPTGFHICRSEVQIMEAV